MKKRIAVFFGGRSPEHDVSIITGLQMLHALNTQKYSAFPVYLDRWGAWLVGPGLDQRKNYFPHAKMRSSLMPVLPDIASRGFGRLLPQTGGLFGKPKAIEFDVALMAFHGLHGEDGPMQGVWHLANVAYTGPRVLDAGIAMDKLMTKRIARNANVPVLPDVCIRKRDGVDTPEKMAKVLSDRNLAFPVIVKPNRLGSSVGVAPAKTPEEALGALQYIFRLDDAALLEPFLQNFTEYNVAVIRKGTQYITSAIERPRRSEELLSFKQKYLSGGQKTGQKLGGQKQALPSEGMLSMTREINPDIPDSFAETVRGYATNVVRALNGSGAPRLDFLYDDDRKQLYFNEINPIPGSFGYFLWQAATPRLNTDELLDHLITEAEELQAAGLLPDDPVPEDARLFGR